MSHQAVFLSIGGWALIFAIIGWTGPYFGFADVASSALMIATILFALFTIYALPSLLIYLFSKDEKTTHVQ